MFPSSTISNAVVSASPFLVSLPFTLLDLNKFDKWESKALWQPPGFVFGTVWPVLYLGLFYMNYCILQVIPQFSSSFKNIVKRDTLIEAGLQAIWLWNFRYQPDIKGRSQMQYIKGLISMISLVLFACYRIWVFYHHPSSWQFTIFYIPYAIWISFATILNYQLVIGKVKL